MRFATRLGGFVVLVCVCFTATSCDSDQPLQVTTQELALTVTAVNALTRTLAMWDIIEDNDLDGVADDGITYVWCEGAPSNISVVPTTVPWPFSVRISIIPAGETQAIVLTDGESAGNNFAVRNVALYDTGSVSPMMPPQLPPSLAADLVDFVITVDDGGEMRSFRIVQNSNRYQPIVDEFAMRSDPSPLAVIQGRTAIGDGVCNDGNPGDARVDNIVQPVTRTINKGDTVIVEARLGETPLPGTGLGSANVPVPPSGISFQLLVDGRVAQVSGTQSGAAVSFSYTAR